MERPVAVELPSFGTLAAAAAPRLEELALALAQEFDGVDVAAARATLDGLGAEVAELPSAGPEDELGALAAVLHDRHGFTGDRERYDDPANSMLDAVLRRRRGLPILLSVLWVAVAERAGIVLAGVGLPGHYVVGHFGAEPPLLADPFNGGRPLPGSPPAAQVRPWTPHETALRMLNNLEAAYGRRSDLARQLHAAELRLALPLDGPLRRSLTLELASLRSRLN